MKVGKNAQQYAKGRAAMPEVMAINKDRQGAQKFMGPKPINAAAQRYAKGGKVKHDDAAQDKALISKMINSSMPRSKMAKYADGGKVNSPEMQDKLREAEKESRRIMRNAQLKKDYRDAGKEDLWNEIQADFKNRSLLNDTDKVKEKGYSKGGPVLSGDAKFQRPSKAKPALEKVTGKMLKAEAGKDVKPMKLAAGGAAKLRRKSPTPNAPKKGTLVGGLM
jgi:hypothetical protein